MSTFTAIGPALDIDGPLPTRPDYGLLSIPGVLQAGDGRWENGVRVYGYPEEAPASWEPCSAGTYRAKDEGGVPPQPRFDAVGLYVPITCSTLGMGDWREFARRAERVLDATLSFGVEQVLSQGVVGSLNPFLADAGVTKLNGGAATAALNALSFLEQAIGETGRKGIIHADNATAAAWSMYLETEGDAQAFAGPEPPDPTDPNEPSVAWAYTTGNGTPVAIGGGYIGAAANGSAPGAGNSWAFATGPVKVFVSESRLVGEDINGTLDTSSNEATFRAERFVLPVWDTSLQSAVLVDWTP